LRQRLHERKPNTIGRTRALIFAAAILYIPANYCPVLSVVQLVARQPSTIRGSVEELITARRYPLAALMFLARFWCRWDADRAVVHPDYDAGQLHGMAT
jgi:uncharacterized paraquat-inducible protein A